MTRYQTPGVYFEEVLAEKPPEFVTGVPAFVGFFADALEKDDAGFQILTPRTFGHSAQRPGQSMGGGFLGEAVRGFFENGGERCVVVPLGMDTTDAGAMWDLLRDTFRQEGRMDDLEDIDLVCVPDLMALGDSAAAEVQTRIIEVQCAVLEHCQRMGERFAILDALPFDAESEQHGGASLSEAVVRQLLAHRQALMPGFGALYFPWLRVTPAAGSGSGRTSHGNGNERGDARRPGADALRRVPPCGHVAGIYARTDARFGFHKAPANEAVEGVVDLDVALGDAEQTRLNDLGVNCIRHLSGRGFRVWGARTLSPQPVWRYVNVRRVFLALNRWVERNLRDLVFEPHVPALWDRIRARLGGFCYDLFRRGALKGLTPQDAFFVKCDVETNPPEVRDSGRLIAEVGLAAEVPAEFIIVRITQTVAGTAITVPSAT